MFAMAGEGIINLMSSIGEVREESRVYLPWLIAFPLISMWSFLLDGLFVGATLGREMRNGMIIAATVYFISYGALHNYDNHALWGSMLIFMAARWIVLSCILKLKPIEM
jgi:MATE family multidrug resistance protein